MMTGGQGELTAAQKAEKAEDKTFVKKELHAEFYTRVKSSDVFYRRKRLILENLDILEKKVKHQAENYDTFRKFKFIAMEK